MSLKISLGPIKRRTVLYIEESGLIRFPGWALAHTTLGTMAEPFQIDLRQAAGADFADFDPSDPHCRIDELRNISPGSYRGYLLGDQRVTGGDLQPRVFKRTGNFVE